MAHLGIRYEVGISHATNQDACCFKSASTLDGEVVLAVICDGVGGLELGELASSSVASAFSAWFEGELPAILQDDNIELMRGVKSSWSRLLQNLDEAIRLYGEEFGGSLATTCTAMLCAKRSYLIAHVGDCRVYELLGPSQKQLTEDQTLLARELARGAITPEEAKTFPGENIILQAIGAPNGIVPSFYTGSVREGAIYILATDGAYRKPGNAGVAAAFADTAPSDESLTRACGALVETALGLGETDNLTALAFSTAGGGDA